MAAKNRKRKKLKGNLGIYGGAGLWAFVNPVPGGYELVHQPVSCKDWSHEVISDQIHKKRIACITVGGNVGKYKTDKFRYVLITNTDGDTQKKLYSAKRYINSIEKLAGLECKMRITEVDIDKLGVRAFVITGDTVYIDIPPLMHWVMGLLRSAYKVPQQLNKKNFKKYVENTEIFDLQASSHVEKNDIALKMLKYREELLDGFKRSDIYIKRTQAHRGYHAYFGIFAACAGKFANEDFEKRLKSFYKKHNIHLLTGKGY